MPITTLRCRTSLFETHRTLGLRLNLSEQPDLAVVAVTHSLASQIFYLRAEAQVVGIQPIKIDLAAHADGIENTPAGSAWAERHANWARQMPRDVTNLWTFVAELDHDSRMAVRPLRCPDRECGQAAVRAEAARPGNGGQIGASPLARHDRLLAADGADLSGPHHQGAYS